MCLDVRSVDGFVSVSVGFLSVSVAIPTYFHRLLSLIELLAGR